MEEEIIQSLNAFTDNLLGTLNLNTKTTEAERSFAGKYSEILKRNTKIVNGDSSVHTFGSLESEVKEVITKEESESLLAHILLRCNLSVDQALEICEAAIEYDYIG